MSSSDQANPNADPDHDEQRPDVGDIPARPASPAVIRFLGCQAEMAGLSTDYFTAGRTDDCDLRLPDELGGDASIVLRFSRGAEGWRVSPSEHRAVFVNQERVRGLTPLRSGDVIRFAPGGAGMQFNIVHQNAAPLANLVAKHAPRLLGDQAAPPPGDESAVGGVAPLRYEAGGRSAAGAASAGALAAPQEERTRLIDPAVLVAGAILLAGAMLGAAVLYTTPSGSGSTPATVDQPPPSETSPDGADTATPDGTPVVPIDQPEPPAEQEEPAGQENEEEQPADQGEQQPEQEPGPEAEPPAPATAPPPPAIPPTKPAEPVDPEALIDDPFG